MKLLPDRSEVVVEQLFPRASARGLIEAAAQRLRGGVEVVGFLVLRHEASLKRQRVGVAHREGRRFLVLRHEASLKQLRDVLANVGGEGVSSCFGTRPH